MTDTSQTVPPLRIAPPPPGWTPVAPTASGPTRMATASLVLGIVSLVLNVLLVPTILAVVFGATALTRDAAGRVRATVGIVLGGMGLLAALIQIAVLIPVLIAAVGGAHHVPLHLRMAADIEQGLNQEGTMVVSDVRCPVAGDLYAGKRITCTADRSGVGPIRIDVTFTSEYGAYTYVTDSAPVG